MRKCVTRWGAEGTNSKQTAESCTDEKVPSTERTREGMVKDVVSYYKNPAGCFFYKTGQNGKL